MVAAAIGVLVTADVVREVQLGTADAMTWFSAFAAYVGLAAAVAVGRWPERRRMALWILAWLLTGAVIDLAGDWPDSRLAYTLLLLALALQPPVYSHMALAYPSGRVRERLERAFLIVAYAVSLVWELTPALFFTPRGCANCGPSVPSLLFTGHTFDLTPLGHVYWSLFIALGVAFIALIIRRLLVSPPGALRTMLPLAAAAFFAGAELIVTRIAWLTGWDQALGTLDWLDSANLLIVPAAVFLGIATIRRHRGPLGDLVVELASARPGEVQAALARAVGDPTLRPALWLPDHRQFVDEHGVTVTLEQDSPGRAVTLLGPDHEPLAAIVHDASLLGQRPLLEAAGSAARLALENARLNAELRAQLAELRESRARIVAVGEAERRRLERDLHDGAQQRLLALGLALQLMRDNRSDPELLVEAEAELQAALHDLRELARGIHPAILAEHGLPAAIGSLSDRAPLPVTTEVAPERYPPAVESAAYFVVSEALANISKHARATSAEVSIGRQDGRVVVEISDDGSGGADPATGSGLQGLADRVGALDGRFTVLTDPTAGTTIRAEIPCASS